MNATIAAALAMLAARLRLTLEDANLKFDGVTGDAFIAAGTGIA